MLVLPIEATLELWASSLRDVKARMWPLFTQERVAVSAGQFLDGLVGEEPRKIGWMREEAAKDRGPWLQQAILGRGRLSKPKNQPHLPSSRRKFFIRSQSRTDSSLSCRDAKKSRTPRQLYTTAPPPVLAS